MQVELLKKKIETGGISFPKVFMACGTEDHLLNANRTMRDFFQESGLDVTYRESKGGHDWDFWDQYIKEALEWLPLDEKNQGINSGNVK